MKNARFERGTIEYVISDLTQDGQKPRLLLHACCGPCASSVLDYLCPNFDITVYFYNPNIMPKKEFNMRLDALKQVISHFEGVKLVVPTQDEREYVSLVKGMESLPEGGSRCEICFAMRLENTAKYLAEHGEEFDFFATTLTVSPHKNADLINRIGKRIAQKYGVEYLSSNFKKRDGYLKSIQLCKEWDIYRQSYCGCNFQANMKLPLD